MSSNLILLWKRTPSHPAPVADVADRLNKLFEGFFRGPPDVYLREGQSFGLVYVELPVRHWPEPFFQSGAGRWAVAPEYPLNASPTLRADETTWPDPEKPLLSLDGYLRKNGASGQEALMAPYSLFSGDDQMNTVVVQNDGLGTAQVFEYETTTEWVMTNRLFALKALGITPKPVAEEWAARWAADFFPGQMTGFSDVRCMAPGERVEANRDRIVRSSTSLYDSLLCVPQGAPLEHAEAARVDLVKTVADVAGAARKHTLFLSGGRDSRAVASVMLRAGVPISAQVGGAHDSPDVIVARELAQVAGFPLKITDGSAPTDSAEAGEASIRRCLQWDAGCRITKNQKYFLRGNGKFGGGRLKINGKHGEIARGYLSREARLHAVRSETAEGYIQRLAAEMPGFILPDVREAAIAVLRDRFRWLERFEVPPERALEVFYVHERLRRRACGSHAAKSGIIFSPFLRPAVIRAANAFPVTDLFDDPLHRHITSVNMPEWEGIPFADDIPAVRAVAEKRGWDVASSSPSAGRASWQTRTDGENYDNVAYWETTGAGMIKDALERGGFWHEIFDPSRAAKGWRGAPDELVISSLISETLLGPEG